MSQVRNQSIISMKAFNTSLPAYRILTMGTATANKVMVWDTSTCLMIGASASDGSSTNDAIKVVIGGTCKLMAGENISTGSLITPQTATGKAMLAVNAFVQSTTSAPRSFGVALEGISVGAYGEVLIMINNVTMTKV